MIKSATRQLREKAQMRKEKEKRDTHITSTRLGSTSFSRSKDAGMEGGFGRGCEVSRKKKKRYFFT